ncbi:MAG: hypothetical protein ABI873_01275 [Marmoricola sp.]
MALKPAVQDLSFEVRPGSVTPSWVPTHCAMSGSGSVPSVPTWWLTGSAVGIALAVAVLLLGRTSRLLPSPPERLGHRRVPPFLVTQFWATGQLPSLVGFLVATVGSFDWGHEYRHCGPVGGVVRPVREAGRLNR